MIRCPGYWPESGPKKRQKLTNTRAGIGLLLIGGQKYAHYRAVTWQCLWRSQTLGRISGRTMAIADGFRGNRQAVAVSLGRNDPTAFH